jgi:hypothetical protein
MRCSLKPANGYSVVWDAARTSLKRSVRRVHSDSDLEWPRLKHDMDSDIEGLDRALRSAP